MANMLTGKDQLPNHKIKTVLIEYSPSEKRIIVRAVFDGKNAPKVPLLEQDNYQNYVQAFEGIACGNCGFQGLVPEQ